MNTITPIRTSQHGKLIADVSDLLRRAYDHGYTTGERVGETRERANRARKISDAVGIGFMYGFAACATIIVLVIGWPL